MGTKSQTKLVKTYVDADTKAQLERIAKDMDRSVAFVLRLAVSQYVGEAVEPSQAPA